MKEITQQYITPTLCFVTIIWLAGLWGFYIHIYSLPKTDPDKTTQAIVVLTGGPKRINTGFDLLEQGKAKYLFISGVNTKVSVEQLLSMWKEDLETEPCCIILGHIAKNTSENASEAKDWIDMNNIQSIRLITANYHMPRALLEFEAIMPEMSITPHALKHNSHNILLLMNEYNKTMVTKLRLKFSSNSI